MKHKALNTSSKERSARRERMKGRSPHSIGKLTRGKSQTSCFLRPYMDTKPAPRTDRELLKMGWTYHEPADAWTAPDGTCLPGDRVRQLLGRGAVPGNRKTKRAASKARRMREGARGSNIHYTVEEGHTVRQGDLVSVNENGKIETARGDL